MRKKIAVLLTSLLAAVTCLGFVSGCSPETMPGYQQPARDAKIMLDVNGGTGLEKSVYEGKTGDAVTLPTPTREGCKFLGWYYKASGEKFTSTTFNSIEAQLVARYEVVEDMPVVLDLTSNKEFSGAGGTYGYAVKFSTEHLSAEDKLEYAVLLENTSIPVTIEAEWDAKIQPTGIYGEASPATDYAISYVANSLYHEIGEVTIENTFNEFIHVSISCETTAKRVSDKDRIIVLTAQNGISQGDTTYYFKNIVAKISFTIPAGTVFK